MSEETAVEAAPVEQEAIQEAVEVGERETRDASDEKLREPGIKALKAERDRADRLESELKPMRDYFSRLKSVFGDEANESQSTEDMVSSLQQQIDGMRHDSLVNDVARRHGITDDADVELLRTTKDADLMSRLAERLKVVEKPVEPDTDPGQGKRRATSPDDAAYEQFYPNPS